MQIMKVSVYLGSSTICLEEYNTLAYELGKSLALGGHTVVYGGSDVGTMKHLADGAQNAGGKVVGVFPEGFAGTIEVAGQKIMRDNLDEMILTRDFAHRKKVMEDLSDCCVVLPGSFGTLDELFDYACRKSIGKHDKGIYILNYKGFYDPLLSLIENMRQARFFKPSTTGVLCFCSSLEEVMDHINAAKA